MSFYVIGVLSQLQGADRRKDDRAALALKLKAKLRELRACGVLVDVDDDDDPVQPASSIRPATPSGGRPLL